MMISAVRPAPARVAVRPVMARIVVARAEPDLNVKISEAMKAAEEACKGGVSGECANAWDDVEELSAAASHKKEEAPMDPLEKYCESDPSADECRVYED